MHAASDLGKLMIFSPHLNDAVFACAQLLARRSDTILVTLLAGMPDAEVPLCDWDRDAGFTSTRQALAQRRAEDLRALELLHATPVWLEFFDSRYGMPPGAACLAESVMALLSQYQPATVMLPAGLHHADHVLAHQAVLLARKRYPQIDWFLYEDTFYRRMPSLLQQRLISLLHYGIDATPVCFDTHAQAERKRHAVQCYASQLRALTVSGRCGLADIYAPEGYWQLNSTTLTC